MFFLFFFLVSFIQLLYRFDKISRRVCEIRSISMFVVLEIKQINSWCIVKGVGFESHVIFVFYLLSCPNPLIIIPSIHLPTHHALSHNAWRLERSRRSQSFLLFDAKVLRDNIGRGDPAESVCRRSHDVRDPAATRIPPFVLPTNVFKTNSRTYHARVFTKFGKNPRT